MFNKEIKTQDLKILNPNFQDYFCKKIVINPTRIVDMSVTAVARLVLYHRLDGDKYVHFYMDTKGYTKTLIQQNELFTVLALCIGEHLGKDNTMQFNLVNICRLTTEEDYASNFEAIRKGFFEYLTDYTELKDVEAYLKPYMTALIYINKKKQDTYVFVRDLNLKRIHLLLSLTPRLLPWYFEDKPLDDDETALLKSLTHRYSPKFIQICNEMTEKRFNFREIFLKQKLNGFENAYYEREIKNIINSQKICRDNMNSAGVLYTHEAQKLQDLIIREAGIRESMIDGNQENVVLDYFLCNKSVDLIKANNIGYLKFIVRTVITNWDPEQADILLKKDSLKSAFFRNYNTGFKKFYENQMSNDCIAKLVKALFIDEILKLRVCAAYVLNFSNKGISALAGYLYDSDYDSYTPNQHIHRYACLGHNEIEIRKAVAENDYVMAIESCIASAQNMNMIEPNTVSYFMKEVLNPAAGQIIQMPDGTTKTPAEAVEWLENQENKTEDVKEVEKE